MKTLTIALLLLLAACGKEEAPAPRKLPTSLCQPYGDTRINPNLPTSTPLCPGY